MMANNLKHPLEDPPYLSSSSSEKEIEFISSEEDEVGHTIFSSEEDEPEDPPPKSSEKDICGSSESQLSGRKRLFSKGVSTKVRSKRAKKMRTNTSSYRRLFSENDEIVLLQGLVDYKGNNPLADKRPLYESIKDSFSFDVTFDQFSNKIRHMKNKYTAKEKSCGLASIMNRHQQKLFQLSKAIWGAQGIAFESANGKSKESKRRVTKKLDLASSHKGKNVQGSKKGDLDKSPHAVTEADWDESSFFLGMDFLKEKWTKVPTESKKKTQEKMKKLHANDLECQKFEEMLKGMKDQCAHDKVELLNEVTSLIISAD